MEKNAVIDPTGLYRYSLSREWDADGSRIVFVMLNPSRADGNIDDPTIRRCLGFAQTWGYGSLEVVNLFAYRTSHPNVLRHVTDPVGPDNDLYLKEAVDLAHMIILAWGNGGSLEKRSQKVIKYLNNRKNIYCLGITKTGQPLHPLYVKKYTQPVFYTP